MLPQSGFGKVVSPTHGFKSKETLLNDLDNHYSDALKISSKKSDGLRDFLFTYLPRTMAYSKTQRDFMDHITNTTSNPFFIPLIIASHSETPIPALRLGFGRGTTVDGLARLLFGIFGGLLLLIPLVVLTFIHSIHYRLLATTLFTFIFVVILALFSNASNVELIGSVAAYAAVLVVFVGSALSSN